MSERERFVKWIGNFSGYPTPFEAWQAAKAEAAERERALVDRNEALAKSIEGALGLMEAGMDDSACSVLEAALAQHESKEASDDQ